MKWRDRKIETVRMRVGDIQPHPMNPKIHPAGQLEPLKGLLETVGKLDDLKAYRSERAGGALVFFDGHGRQALDPNAEWDVDVYDLTDAEADLAVATFDPIGWQAEQSRVKLDELLREVSTGNEALMNLLTKQAEECGLYFGNEPQAPGAGGDEFDTTPEETQTRVRYGDLWQCGEHRVLCGDSTNAEDVGRVMAGEKAGMMWADPPYGVSYVGKTADALTIPNDGAEGLPALLRCAFAQASNALESGAPFYIAHPAGALCLTFGQAIIEAGWRFHQTLIWCKDSMVLGHSDYHFQHEPIYYGWTAGEGRSGRGNHEGSRWRGDHSQVSVFHVPRPKRSDEHPTSKPVSLVTRGIENSSEIAGRVYDPFGGSGTTLIACERTNRKARLIEIEPKYVNVILSRWEAETGKSAQLLERMNP